VRSRQATPVPLGGFVLIVRHKQSAANHRVIKTPDRISERPLVGRECYGFLSGAPAMNAPWTLNKTQFFAIIIAVVGVVGLVFLFAHLKNSNEANKTSPQRQISEDKSPPQQMEIGEEKSPPQQMEIGEEKSPPQQTVKMPSMQAVTPDASGRDALHLGNTYFDAKAYDLAIQQYDYAIAHGSPAYYVRGIAWLEKRNYEQAIADFTQAIQREAGYYLTYFHRADAYAHKGDRDSAIADYRRALALKPDEAAKKQIMVGLERLGAEPELQKDVGAQETKRRARTKNR
jgi:type IV secretory pathway VirB10-like protein